MELVYANEDHFKMRGSLVIGNGGLPVQQKGRAYTAQLSSYNVGR